MFGIYAAGAMLFDGGQPARILARTAQPLLELVAPFAPRGLVPGVVFPIGIIRCGETLRIYYGAAVTCTVLVEVALEAVLRALR